jgi:hypothetical protein
VTVEKRLRALIAEVIEEARRNPDFSGRLGHALGGETTAGAASGRRRHRRDPAPFDPFVVYQVGEHALRARLDELDVEQLKDIVAEHGMDGAKLAMKWKSADRLIELIVASITSRSRKGDVFRGETSP